MLVYIVTQGEYSDYHIEKVFEDKEKAQEYCYFHVKYFNWHEDEYAIETYDTNDFVSREVFVEAQFKADLCRNVNILAHGQNGFIFKRNPFFPNGWYDIQINFGMVPRVDETKRQLEERAKKIAIDKYFQWKSEAKQCE